MHLKLATSLKALVSGTFLLFFFLNTAKAQLIQYIKNDSTQARKDIVDVLFGNKRDSILQAPDHKNDKFFFSMMPISGSSGQKGVGISTINASFYLGNPATTRLSNVTFFPTTNFYSYLKFKALLNIWSSENAWNFPGKMELYQTAEDNYGLGSNTPSDSLFVIEYRLRRAYLNCNKSLGNNFYLGLGYYLDYFTDVQDLSDSIRTTHFESYEYGTTDKTVSSGIGFNFLFDSRVNSINPLGGFYTSFQYRVNNPWVGSKYSWQSIYFDTRKYFTFDRARHRTLAVWGLYWGTFGEVPYLNLPGTALDYSNWTGRGYYKARYRGKQMLYAEAEYRFDFSTSGLWGGVLFANAQSYIEPDSKKFEYLIPAVGTGLRLKFNKYSDSNITFDVAVGKDSWNWYFSLNEVF
jgi:hypothetical protein